MRRVVFLVLLAQTAMVAGFAIALGVGAMPLGVKGEWEWLRLPVAPLWFDLLLASLAVVLYAFAAGVGMRALAGKPSRLREAVALLGLLGASVTIQCAIPSGAPDAYGLAKWALVLQWKASSGYYTVAKEQIHDPWRFLANYPEWIRHQDALHVGTHPPGLFLLEHALVKEMEAHPGLTRFTLDHIPTTVEAGFRSSALSEFLPRPDRAALAWTGALTLLACAATVVPLYLLARASLPAPAAWACAALWPLVPSAILFQPVADTAFPFLSTLAIALGAHAERSAKRSGVGLAIGAGIVLAVGMQFTLAFLPVGLIVGIVLATGSASPWRRRLVLIGATGLGFLGFTLAVWGLTGANPFVIWWWNQRNHARFYDEFHRTYRAWVAVNPIELVVALGLPAAVWAGLGFVGVRNVPRASRATLAVLVVLNLSGRNLSEVARIWLLFMPPLLLPAGLALTRLGGDAKALAATVVLLGAQTLALEAMIQVVYPV